MTITEIDVHPTKELFVYMLTRDVKLEKAIIDLIDNSIDAAINSSKSFVKELSDFNIQIKVDKDEFIITDNCGGIILKDAVDYAFKFGRPSDIDKKVGNIGQFGIGMKRTIFKLGKQCLIRSKSIESEFQIDLDIDKWKSDPVKWAFPINVIGEDLSNDIEDTFTEIIISNLYKASSESFSQGNFINELREEIQEAHAYTLSQGLNISINGTPLTCNIPMLKENNKIGIIMKEITHDEGTDEEVKVKIYAGLTDRELSDAGWYIYCNDRLLVSANKNMTTGWGNNGNKFHHDFAFFRGYVFFESLNGDVLPWTTTKDGINFNSDIYQSTLGTMQNEIKVLLETLKLLGKETTAHNKDPDNVDRKIHDDITDLIENGEDKNLKMITSPQQLVIPNYSVAAPRKMGTISYSKPLEELNELKSKLGTSINREVGLKTYDYYYENEME